LHRAMTPSNRHSVFASWTATVLLLSGAGRCGADLLMTGDSQSGPDFQTFTGGKPAGANDVMRGKSFLFLFLVLSVAKDAWGFTIICFWRWAIGPRWYSTRSIFWNFVHFESYNPKTKPMEFTKVIRMI